MRINRLFDYVRIGGYRVAVPLLSSLFVGVGPLAKVSRDDVEFLIHLRVRTSDYSCYEQIFENKEYALDTRRQPKVIVDAGANVGLASIYFANKFPRARIIAIEPEISNYQLLERNCAPYERITTVRGALWSENTEIRLVDPGTGKWGFMTRTIERDEGSSVSKHHLVPGMTMDRLMDMHDIQKVDILKMDIEGSEKEVFHGQPTWIDKVDTIIIETHEWLRPGCERRVNEATAEFDDRWQQGENQFIVRRRGCVVRHRVHQAPVLAAQPPG